MGLLDNEDWATWLTKNGIPVVPKSERAAKEAKAFGKGTKRNRRSIGEKEKQSPPKVAKV